MMGREREAEYYDGLYAHQSRRSRTVSVGRHRHVADLVVGDSVLDLGCGVALLANYIEDREYLGVDFSAEAIHQSRLIAKNPNATFLVASFDELVLERSYDTVVLMEVLEHLTQPKRLTVAALALAHCKRRLVATVPRDMRAPSHVKRAWTCPEIEELVGPLDECYLYGGPNEDWYWLAVRDL